MGAKNKRKKPPSIVDAEITDDGMLVIELNQAIPLGNSKKIILPADTLMGLAEEYASMPPAADTEYPGVPVLEYWDVFSEDEEEGEGDADDQDTPPEEN